mmetsp:Transcript_33952/g.106418  ORF Transcript_33952/g.106418 Transcript_33952/m.106418 type:complete len:208 (-) Transcript_33952:647-1270(-)
MKEASISSCREELLRAIRKNDVPSSLSRILAVQLAHLTNKWLAEGELEEISCNDNLLSLTCSLSLHKPLRMFIQLFLRFFSTSGSSSSRSCPCSCPCCSSRPCPSSCPSCIGQVALGQAGDGDGLQQGFAPVLLLFLLQLQLQHILPPSLRCMLCFHLQEQRALVPSCSSFDLLRVRVRRRGLTGDALVLEERGGGLVAGVRGEEVA